jgi:hypothetical protein
MHGGGGIVTVPRVLCKGHGENKVCCVEEPRSVRRFSGEVFVLERSAQGEGVSDLLCLEWN